MKKTLLAVLFLFPFVSFAQTPTLSQSQILSLIATLTQEVQGLEAQLAAQTAQAAPAVNPNQVQVNQLQQEISAIDAKDSSLESQLTNNTCSGAQAYRVGSAQEGISEAASAQVCAEDMQIIESEIQTNEQSRAQLEEQLEALVGSINSQPDSVPVATDEYQPAPAVVPTYTSYSPGTGAVQHYSDGSSGPLTLAGSGSPTLINGYQVSLPDGSTETYLRNANGSYCSTISPYDCESGG